MNVIKETALTRFSDIIGQRYLNVLFTELYSSGTFRLAMFLAFVGMMVHVGLSLHRGRLPERVLYFGLALGLAVPFRGMPAGFVAIDSLAKALAGVANKATLKFASSSGNPNTAVNMHPGLVMEMITVAASSQVKDLSTRNLLVKFMAKCAPSALRSDGSKARFDDFFDFDVRYENSPTGMRAAFSERVLNEKSLINNKAFSSVDRGASCYEGLKRVRSAMLRDLENRPLVITEKLLTSNTESPTRVDTTEEWLKNWKRRGSPFLGVAKNLQLAMAAQYEKSQLIKNSFGNHYYKDTRMTASMREFMLGVDSNTADFGFAAANLTEMPSRLAGTRWSASLGAAMKELKEKIELIPYSMVVIKNFLRLMAVLAILSLFTGKMQLFTCWAGSWIVANLIPPVINAIRSQHNSIILSKLGIQDLVSQASEGAKALAYKVDIGLAEDLLAEFTPLAYAMMNQEMKIIATLAGFVLTGSWVAGMVGNGIIGRMSSTVQGSVISSATRSTTQATGAVAKAVGSKIPSIPVGAMSYVGGKAFGRSVMGSRAPIPSGPSYSMKAIFPKEKS